MERKSSASVLFVRAPEGSKYATSAGILELDDELSYQGEAGVVFEPDSRNPLMASDGCWLIWIGNRQNLDSVSQMLSQLYGVTVEKTGTISRS